MTEKPSFNSSPLCLNYFMLHYIFSGSLKKEIVHLGARWNAQVSAVLSLSLGYMNWQISDATEPVSSAVLLSYRTKPEVSYVTL